MSNLLHQKSLCALLGATLLALPISAQVARPAGLSPIKVQDLAVDQADSTPDSVGSYILGADDEIYIRVAGSQEIADRPIPIDTDGAIAVPILGRMAAAGLSVRELEGDITNRLRLYILDPQVAVTIAKFGSQPVSIIGSVNQPGIHQLQGRRTLVEMISLAGGLKDDAGSAVKIVRHKSEGTIPLVGVQEDPTGQYNLAEVQLASILKGDRPEENILIRPHDVITVLRGELIYVIGEVEKSGGFVLRGRSKMSALEALALAGGLKTTAAPRDARLLRMPAEGADRVEVPLNVKSILAGKTMDVELGPEDILFIPNSKAKSAATTVLQTAINVGTGMLIWR